MQKFNASILKESLQTQISSKTLQSNPLRVKMPSTQRKLSNHSLSDSIVSTKSDLPKVYYNNKKSNSFYNDHNRIYENRSRIMSEKNMSFQNKAISFSARKKYQSDKTQNVVQKRNLTRSLTSTQNLTQRNSYEERGNIKSELKKRFQNLTSNKYKKLLYGESIVQANINILNKNVKRCNSQKSGKQWKSPFANGNNLKNKFEGKALLPKQIVKICGNQDPTQLKVLNLDRLFRLKDGKMSNVVPLPVAKLSEISSRSNVMKVVKSRDRIHDVIKQYNQLIRIMKFTKTAPRLGVKGKNFTKTPTIQQLMGIKLNPSKSSLFPQDQMLDQQTFITQCQHFIKNIKKDIHLTRRLISGLIQNQNDTGISLQAFTRFYLLFVNKIATLQEKVNFLIYFFIPQGQDKVQFSVLKLILQIMCQALPSIQKLKVEADLLSSQQKSKIFLEALNRVLFSQIQSELLAKGGVSRQMLKAILQNNPDASDLIIKLLELQ